MGWDARGSAWFPGYNVVVNSFFVVAGLLGRPGFTALQDFPVRVKRENRSPEYQG